MADDPSMCQMLNVYPGEDGMGVESTCPNQFTAISEDGVWCCADHAAGLRGEGFRVYDVPETRPSPQQPDRASGERDRVRNEALEAAATVVMGLPREAVANRMRRYLTSAELEVAGAVQHVAEDAIRALKTAHPETPATGPGEPERTAAQEREWWETNIKWVFDCTIENATAMKQYGGHEGRLRELAALFCQEVLELRFLQQRSDDLDARTAELMAKIKRLTAMVEEPTTSSATSGDQCGVCARPTTNKNHEPVGRGLPPEPTCDDCLRQASATSSGKAGT